MFYETEASTNKWACIQEDSYTCIYRKQPHTQVVTHYCTCYLEVCINLGHNCDTTEEKLVVFNSRNV